MHPQERASSSDNILHSLSRNSSYHPSRTDALSWFRIPLLDGHRTPDKHQERRWLYEALGLDSASDHGMPRSQICLVHAPDHRRIVRCAASSCSFDSQAGMNSFPDVTMLDLLNSRVGPVPTYSLDGWLLDYDSSHPCSLLDHAGFYSSMTCAHSPAVDVP